MSIENKKKNSIKGIIVPGTWDHHGNITGVTIQAYDEKAYFVEHTVLGKELLNHIHQKVEVAGKIREKINGSISIRVQNYKVMAGGTKSKKLPIG